MTESTQTIPSESTLGAVPPTRGVSRASDARRILVISAMLPAPDRAAGDARFFNLLQCLARRNQVSLYRRYFLGDDATEAKYTRIVEGAGVRVLPLRWPPFKRALVDDVYDLVVFEFWQWADVAMAWARARQPWAKMVIDTVDVHFLREEAGLALGQGDASEIAARKAKEMACYRAADALGVVTEEDGAAIRAGGCDSRQYMLRNVALRRDRNAAAPASAGSREPALLFVGGFRHAPNVDGILWFAREAWPAIFAARPDTTLMIVGSAPTPEVKQLAGLPGVELHADVPDMAPFLDRATASVAPLRFGAGMKGKVTEAMGAGLPVVTTTVGAQGLAAESGTHLFIADDGPAFAQAVLQLLDSPEIAARVGAAGQAHVLERCSLEAMEATVNRLIAELCPKPGPATKPAALAAASIMCDIADAARGTVRGVVKRKK
jgi:glycosyltransferase involved in cell wall biosynthesis